MTKWTPPEPDLHLMGIGQGATGWYTREQLLAAFEAGASKDRSKDLLPLNQYVSKCVEAETTKLTVERNALAKKVEVLRDALEKLARLGNGDKYGNSVGNEIARAALEATK